MFKNLPLEDQRQLFLNCLLMFRGSFVYVEEIRQGYYKLFDLNTQTIKVYEGNVYEEFNPVYKRLGFINLAHEVVHAARTTIRQFIVGYSRGNVRFTVHPNGEENIAGKGSAFDSRTIFKSKEMLACLKNEYPSIKEAANIAAAFGHPVAFDKQFFINPSRSVCYRNMGRVGVLKDRRVTIEGIAFDPEFQCLKTLLENPCGKDLRTIEKSSRIW